MLIRKTEPKPIRIFLQDGRNDQNNYTGSSFIANQDMQAALEYAGYDVRHEWGDGEHNSRHATELFPEALRWLWRDYPAPINANPDGKSRQDVFQVLLPGEDWQVVSEGHRNTDGPAVNGQGEMFFSDPANNRIYRVGLDAKVRVFAEQTALPVNSALISSPAYVAAAGADEGLRCGRLRLADRVRHRTSSGSGHEQRRASRHPGETSLSHRFSIRAHRHSSVCDVSSADTLPPFAPARVESDCPTGTESTACV
jgi:hypothetical protein